MAGLIVLSAACSPAAANTFRIEATFTGFARADDTLPPPPHDPVDFSLVFSDTAAGSADTVIEQISLTLGSKSFEASEIGSVRHIDGHRLFGATVNDVDGIQWGTNDFWFVYDTMNPTDFQFAYSVRTVPYSVDGFWWSDTASSFSISAVPEPHAAWLLSLGVLAVCGMRKGQSVPA